MQNSKPKSSGIKRTLFVFFTILLALFVLELALRLGGYVYLRLKYPSLTVQRKSNEYSILCLGDSFTQGFGAPKGYSYPEQLAKLLNDDPDHKDKFNVYKEFYINSSTILKYLTKDIERYRPDLIIIMTGCNDRWSLENCTYFILENSNLLTKINIWLSNSNVYKLVKISLLNLRGLLTNAIPRLNQQALVLNQKVKGGTRHLNFKNPTAETHYQAGQDYFKNSNYDLALKEYKAAEQLEPENSGVHFRLACIYIQVLKEYDLGRKHALLTLTYGDSSMLGCAFMLMHDPYEENNDQNNGIITDMENVIKASYKSGERTEALRYLKILSSFYRDEKEIEKVINYNLNEIIKITREHKIKLILMQYPMFISWASEVINKRAHLFKIPLVDNFTIFEDKLKESKLNREDLFAKDGHCNTLGYGVIAENVYKSLVQNRVIDGIINR